MCEKEPLPPPQDRRRKDDRNQRAIRHALSHPFRQAWRAFQYVDGAYLRGHPELELFPTEQQRRRALRRVVSKFLWRRAFWWAAAKTMALAVSLTLLVFALAEKPLERVVKPAEHVAVFFQPGQCICHAVIHCTVITGFKVINLLVGKHFL